MLRSHAGLAPPEKAFTDAAGPARGAESASQRNAMPLFNLAWKKDFFLDGRRQKFAGTGAAADQNPTRDARSR